MNMTKMMAATMAKWLPVLIDAAFPRRCPVCGEPARPTGHTICTDCLPRLDLVREPRCMKCGRELSDETERLCAECTVRERSFVRGLALLHYDDIMRRTVGQIKYGNRREYIEPLARLMYLKFCRELQSMDPDCLIPVPVHRSRLRRRGFNQAALLAHALGAQAGLPVREDILFRSRRTEAQKELSPDERIRNLSEAFSACIADEGSTPGRVVLVDDIYTTGSTIEACARALRAAGVGQVYFLALCIVPVA